MWPVEGLAVRCMWAQEGKMCSAQTRTDISSSESAEAFKTPPPSLPWLNGPLFFNASASLLVAISISSLALWSLSLRRSVTRVYLKRNVLVVSCLLKSCLDFWRLSMSFFCHASLNHLLFVRQYFLYTFHETKKCEWLWRMQWLRVNKRFIDVLE